MSDGSQLDEVANLIFMGADEDGNGYVDKSEFQSYVIKMGKNETLINSLELLDELLFLPSYKLIYQIIKLC